MDNSISLQNNDNLDCFVPNVHFELIRIKDLVSNQDYQRNISSSQVMKAVADFNVYQINPVKVSRRNGTNYVFNGQHTVEIVAKISQSRETPVWCMIYDDLDYESEADIFANQQKYIKPLLPFEIFQAHIESGNDKYLLIKTLIESYGLTISPTRTPGGITAISTLEKIYDKYGLTTLDHVLRLISETWEGAYLSFSANMLNGVARLLAVYQDQLKDELFIQKLGRISIKEISRMAKERRAGSIGYSETLLIYYNKKMHNPLPMNYLYSYNGFKKRISMYENQENNDENEAIKTIS